VGGGALVVGRRARMYRHKDRAIRPASAWEFWCGLRGGVSHRRAWKAPADALCVAPAPRGRSRPRAAGGVRSTAVFRKMVEVPNPAKFLG
jgi:hypothetical protein